MDQLVKAFLSSLTRCYLEMLATAHKKIYIFWEAGQ